MVEHVVRLKLKLQNAPLAAQRDDLGNGRIEVGDERQPENAGAAGL